MNLQRIVRKAQSSKCRYKVAAIGFNKKGEVVGISYNSPRFSRIGGSVHAEMNLLRKFGKKLHSIMIFRIGQSGNILPIEVCKNCREALGDIRILKTKI